MTILDLLIQLGVGIPLVAWIVRFDMRRLPPDRLVRAWNVASFWSAVVAFGPLCIPVHFVRTRRSAWGLVLGLLWAALALGALSLITGAVSALVS